MAIYKLRKSFPSDAVHSLVVALLDGESAPHRDTFPIKPPSSSHHVNGQVTAMVLVHCIVVVRIWRDHAMAPVLAPCCIDIK